MFLEYWKLREQPFGVTPDPKYLYFSAGHREALASVFCGIEMGRGFLSLIARPGMGKTTLIFQLLRRWKGHVQSAFLFQTQCTSRELIRYLLDDLGLNSAGDDIVRMHADLNDFLVREAKAGKRVVVFIDEAQNLPNEVLETVRLLSNFEASDKKLLQIVLAGQPELAQRLSRPGLAQLSQRIAVRAQLDPLPAAEVVNYVKHRLRVAGCEDPQLFTPGALGIVAELSQGIPRLINAMCFNALSLGLAMKSKQVSSEIVREAAKDFGLGSGSSVPMRKMEPAPAPRLIVHPAPSLWQSLGSRIRDVVKRRLVQASGLCLVFGLMAILFAGDKQRGAAPPTVVGRASPATNKMTTGAEPSVSPPPQTNVAGDPSRPALQQADLPEISPRSFGYVIQPHDTIRGLCLSAFKRYDADVLLEIRRLNPGLKDINRLEVGQEIQLPLSVGE
jgi:type II secretory pathway predicted ATPase ExeA